MAPALAPTQTPRDAFEVNQALLSLNVLAHNLLNLGRRLAERAQATRGRCTMSLRTFRQLYLKIPARLTLHSRRVWVSIATPVAGLWRELWDDLEQLGAVPVVN